MFRHVWYELTGNFIFHFLEVLKIPSSFSSGVKLPYRLIYTFVRPCGRVQESQVHKGIMWNA